MESSPVEGPQQAQGQDIKLDLTVEGGRGVARAYDPQGNEMKIALLTTMGGDKSRIELSDGFSLPGGSLVNSPGIVAFVIDTIFAAYPKTLSVTVESGIDLGFGDEYKDGGLFWSCLSRRARSRVILA